MNLSINSTTDRLTLRNYFAGTAYRVEQVRFNDGTGSKAAAHLRRSHQRPGRPHCRALRADRKKTERRGDDTFYPAPVAQGVGGG